jgi:hypothetical protein
MSVFDPIKGADSSDNNELDVRRLASDGYRVLIQRRTGGIDIVNGRRVPYVDRRFSVTNRAIKDTNMIPGDYAFPIDPDYLDLDKQVDAFLSNGPDDFEGRIIAIDYELYGPEPAATIKPAALKEYLRILRRHIGERHILMYAGKSFWEAPPHSGKLSDYGEHMHLWAPKYPTLNVYDHPWRMYQNLLDEMGWWQRFAGDVKPVASQFCIGRAAGIPLDIDAWRVDMDVIRQLTTTPGETA